MLHRLPGFCLVALLAAVVVACPCAAKPPDLPDNPPIIVAPQPRQALTTTILYNVHPITALAPAAQPAQVVWPCPVQSCQPGQPCPTRTVMENLEALEKAAELLALAKNLAREGRYSEALDCLEKGRALVPGSSFEGRANEVFAEMGGHLAFDTFKAAFAEAVSDYWDTRAIRPGIELCWLGQAQDMLEKMGKQQLERRRAGWEYLTRAADQGSTFAFEMLDSLFCQATGCRLPRVVTVHSAGVEAESRHFLVNNQPCPVEVKMCQPVSGRWTSVPLGAVLADLDRTHAVTVVVDPGTCLDQPVSLDVEHKPLAAVFHMLGQPFGLQPKVQGNCVYLTSAKCPTGEECCEEVPGTKVCPATACPQCEQLHVKVVKKQQKRLVKHAKAGVEEQVNGLMKACYLAIDEERYGKATDLAREAHALDPKRVEGDPLVYKFGLLAEKVKSCPVNCSESTKPCCPDCPCQPAKKTATMKGSLTLGVGISSNAGLTGSVVLNERNCDVATCSKSAGQACPCCKEGCKAACASGKCCCSNLSCCGVKMADACQVARQLMKAMYLSPLVTPDDGHGNGCLTLGLSTSGQVNAFCRTRHEGVVYHMMFKDGVFLMWMTPQEKAK